MKMRSKARRTVLVLTVALMSAGLAACGDGDSSSMPEIADARIGQPTGPNAALYLTASGYGTDDSLVGVSTDVAPTVEIHETTMGDDGTMGMQPVPELDLPAEGDLVLEPGGYHIMFIDVDRLDVGDTVEVTLEWENAGEQVITAEVVEPSDTMGDMDHSDMDMDG